MVAARFPIILGLLLVACAGPTSATGPDDENLEGEQPTLYGTLSGEGFDIAGHLGSDAILLAFWRSGCTDCEAQMSFVEALHRAYEGRSLVVAGVLMDDLTDTSTLRALADRYGVAFPLVLDPDGTLASRWNPDGRAPYAVVVAPDGGVVFRREGFALSRAGELEVAVRRALE